MDGAKEFFSGTSFVTLAAASTFVYIVVNGIRVFFGFYRKWIVLLISFLVILVNAFYSVRGFGALELLLILGNTFLLALTAIGLNESIAKGAEEPKAVQHGLSERGFFSSWF